MNGRIEFVSAGAGSGKTHRLTQTVAEALQTQQARPQGVLATTFTVKAAAELRERVRSWLLSQRRVDLATAIGLARIGTVNSVCGQMLKRFCFELGLSPDQAVLSEVQATRLLKATVADALDEERRERLVALSDRLGLDPDHWSDTIHRLVQAALSNGIGEQALRQMGQRNADLMLANWPQPSEDVSEAALTQVLRQASADVAGFVEAQIAAGRDIAKNLAEGQAELQRLVRQFESGRWVWNDWYKASKLDAGAKVRDHVSAAVQLAQAFEAHPAYQADIREQLDLLFQCAADALHAYAEAKRNLGVVDFTDQEALLLQAVRHSDAVRQALSQELDLIVVDEFQDTSPLQLALFIELAQLAKRSVWVGDPKQAIYGFRGTDASLIAGVIQALPQWGGVLGEPLRTSRRSTPELVSLTNAVFGHAFEPDMSAREVELTAHRESLPEQPSLVAWQFESTNKENDFKGMGQAVRHLLAQGRQVQDRETKALRAMEPRDIGILCPYNEQVHDTVESLSAWGIPSSSPRPGLLLTAEATLVLAALRRLHDGADTVATALILSLARGEAAESWMADRLNHVEAEGASRSAWRTEGEGADALVARLEALRPGVQSLTPAEAMRLAAVESDVAGLCAKWSNSPLETRTRQANVEALLSMAKAYEDECVSAKRAATVAGLLRWLDEQADAAADGRAVTADNAVSVLTYHRAKGLEWPVVVLAGLDAPTKTAIWSVRARTEGAFNPAAPLDNRFVHCWLKPLGPRSQPPAVQAAEASELAQGMHQQALAEHKRLLYVGLTRARDINVLAVRHHPKKGLQTGWLDEIPGARQALLNTDLQAPLPDGRPIIRTVESWDAAQIDLAPPSAVREPSRWFRHAGRRDLADLWSRPSSAKGGDHRVAEVEPVGHRLSLTGSVNMADLGQALHLCMAKAAAQGQLTDADAQLALANWGVEQAVQAADVVFQVQAFDAWWAGRWPGAQVMAEVPIEAEGSPAAPGHEPGRIRGCIDCLLKVDAGWVLIDHKANPRGAAGDAELATSYGPQLAAYAQAIQAATGQPVIEAWLFQPVAGRAVRISGDALP